MNQRTDEPIDILAFSPHPDDAEIGCAGALLLAAKAGQRTAIVDVTDGERATRGSPKIRRREREEAGTRLCLAARTSLGLPDTRVAVDQPAVAKVVGVLRTWRPRVVLLPYAEDRHPDHAATTALVKKAVFLAGVQKTFQGRAHKVATTLHYMIHAPFMPSIVVDVSTVWEERQHALAAYASQFDPGAETAATALSHPGFLRALEARGVHYGAMIGAARGEPYWQPGPVAVRQLGDIVPPESGYRMFP